MNRIALLNTGRSGRSWLPALAAVALGSLAVTASAHAGTVSPVYLAFDPAGAGALGLMGLGAFGTTKLSDKTKWFRIAVEGATTDGRTIEREWLEQMAASYDPQLYGARLNLEHIRGTVPDGPFKSYGDVLELKTEDGTGKLEGKLCLLARIKPNANLVALNKDGQKVYTSCEINPNFADTGEAYLVGLAVTDNPASLGTEMLEFSAKSKGKPLEKRKLHPDNLFTAIDEDMTIDLEPEAKGGGLGSEWLAKFTAKLRGVEKDQGKAIAQLTENFAAALDEASDHFNEQIQALTATTKEQAKQIAALTEKLGTTPAPTTKRPLATGAGGGTVKVENLTEF